MRHDSRVVHVRAG